MKYLILFIGVFLFSSSNFAQNVNDRSGLASVKNIQTSLNYLASDKLMGRDAQSEGIEKAAIYLLTELKEYAIKPYFSTYKDTVLSIENTWNIVGVIPGTDHNLKNELVVLGAHYDHIGIIKTIDGDSIANGANDNATGVSILLELARILKQKKLKRTTLICFFAAEEKGLIGSEHLVKRLKDDKVNVVLMLNFEMLGVPMNRSYSMYLTGYEKSNLADKINEIAKEKLVGKLDEAEKMGLFMRSDNYPFYKEFNIPSQTFSSFDFINFNYYHHVKDEVYLMDIEFMTSLTNKLLPVVKKMINFPPGEIRLK